MPGGGRQRHHVVQHILVDADLLHRFAHGHHIVGVDDLVDGGLGRPAVQPAPQHRRLVAFGQIPQFQPDREPVQLGLGQRVGALVLDRVVGRQHDERRWQPVGLAVDADLAFGHRLQQGRLGLRRGPVDFVGEQQVGEDRSAPELETARLHVVDGRPQQVGGQQIRGELHPGEAEPQRRGEGPRDQGFAEPGQVLDQHVAARQHRDQDQAQRGPFADHDAFDLVEHRLAVRGGRRRRLRHTPGHACSNRRRISSSTARPGPGSAAPLSATLLGSTHCHSSSPNSIRPVAVNAVRSFARDWPVAFS
ncbi:hypothetical protein C1Y40_02955 [Mycobacterium talmoniae]|uniref:Uncharacterized protein n=1 Tax=Mycobacterium talmoniae TaxID=1858794 RepID=A0A2S8BJJ7_9MYCO|nr:hypothetical protein C1Y40_02955 [Mycobacterium talmoniae]